LWCFSSSLWTSLTDHFFPQPPPPKSVFHGSWDGNLCQTAARPIFRTAFAPPPRFFSKTALGPASFFFCCGPNPALLFAVKKFSPLHPTRFFCVFLTPQQAVFPFPSALYAPGLGVVSPNQFLFPPRSMPVHARGRPLAGFCVQDLILPQRVNPPPLPPLVV